MLITYLDWYLNIIQQLRNKFTVGKSSAIKWIAVYDTLQQLHHRPLIKDVVTFLSIRCALDSIVLESSPPPPCKADSESTH